MAYGRISILGSAIAIALSACGQKGPLTLPPPVAAPQSRAPGDAANPPPAERPAERPGEKRFPDVPATNEPR